MLGLLGFYDELDDRSGRPNGSIRDAVRPVGAPDETDLVAYLDTGHVLIHVMEAGHDVITGSAHRHSQGCSSLLTDGVWLWRKDFPHYVETHHVVLPEAFAERVRALDYEMPAISVERFAPHYDETMPLIGWATAVPWRSTATTLVPEPRTVTSEAEFDAATRPGARKRRHGGGNSRRKPRRT
ncbi:hypothetical protein [Streptomyces graminilatus]|uniref:hypothetical protein n=1 Tax=Streptomyces graminilatus TaxID=1464070 RepID=UPI0006E31AC8|nr:hypothetical protein [Streptomyces graminilatus]